MGPGGRSGRPRTRAGDPAGPAPGGRYGRPDAEVEMIIFPDPPHRAGVRMALGARDDPVGSGRLELSFNPGPVETRRVTGPAVHAQRRSAGHRQPAGASWSRQASDSANGVSSLAVTG